MTRLGVILCGLCEAEVDVVNLMEEMKITPGLLEKFFFVFVPKRIQLVPKKTQFVPKRRILVPKWKDFLMNEEILNTRGDQAFYMGAENAKIESAEKSAETGGHH
jgi:hypothetical protein